MPELLPEENGLFPGRGWPAGRGAGRAGASVPGAWAAAGRATSGAGRGASGAGAGASGAGTGAAGGCTVSSTAGAAGRGPGDGRRVAGLSAGAAVGSAAGAGFSAAGLAAAAFLGGAGGAATGAAGPAAAAAAPPLASAGKALLSLRTTGGSTVDDADRTNSPISWSLVMTTLLSTPSSLASSYTRTFATSLLSRPEPDRRGPSLQLGGAHRCALIGCSSASDPLPSVTVDLGWGRPAVTNSRTAEESSGPARRRARGNARRRSARSRQDGSG